MYLAINLESGNYETKIITTEKEVYTYIRDHLIVKFENGNYYTAVKATYELSNSGNEVDVEWEKV